MSWVKVGADYKIIGGGGGSASSNTNSDGGSAGGLQGIDGGYSSSWGVGWCQAGGGKGGNQVAGGATGTPAVRPGSGGIPGTPGSYLAGGWGSTNSTASTNYTASGGGGGYYGGGGGGYDPNCYTGAGGGGSSYLAGDVTNGVMMSTPVKATSGMVAPQPAPGSTDPNYTLATNVAKGMNAASGGTGLVVVQWATPVPRIDPKVVKSGPSTVNAGSSISYSVTVTNAGNTVTTAAFGVNDTPPSGLTGTWTCTKTGAVACPVMGAANSLAASVGSGFGPTDSMVFTYTGTVDGAFNPGSLTNTASLAIPGTFVDADTTNNSSSTTAAVTADTDVSVTKTGTTGSVVPGVDCSGRPGDVHAADRCCH